MQKTSYQYKKFKILFNTALIQEQLFNSEYSGYRTSRSESCSGAPRFKINATFLRYLRVHCGFKLKKIASMLHVSVSTVKRRLHDYGISTQSAISTISDAELDIKVQQLIRRNQRIGARAVKVRLQKILDVKVQRSRVQESLRRVDPVGVALRCTKAIIRRNYSVAGPNSVWHIDSNLKLNR